MTRKDIKTKEDIQQLVDQFYIKVRKDVLIGPIFNDIANVNWEKHLPVMYDFWENTIFFTGSYAGNPMKTHQQLNNVFPLKAEHFDRWIRIFLETVDDLFAGEKAELAKQRAVSIATVMKIKLSGSPG